MIDSQRLKGSAIISLQAVCIACTGLLAKLTQLKGIPALQVLSLQAFIAALFLLPCFFKLKKPKVFKRREVIILCLRGFFSLACVGSYFYSLQRVPLTTALLLFNSGPLFVPFVLWTIRSKVVSLKVLLYIVLGFFGIVLILNPQYQHIDRYYILALISGVFSSFVSVTTGIVSRKNLLPISIAMVLPTQAIVFGLLSISSWVAVPLDALPFLIGAGAFWAIIQLCFTAFKFACASVLAPLIFISVVVSGVFDWYIWHQVLEIEIIIGICLVILASVLVLTSD